MENPNLLPLALALLGFLCPCVTRLTPRVSFPMGEWSLWNITCIFTPFIMLVHLNVLGTEQSTAMFLFSHVFHIRNWFLCTNIVLKPHELKKMGKIMLVKLTGIPNTNVVDSYHVRWSTVKLYTSVSDCNACTVHGESVHSSLLVSHVSKKEVEILEDV